MALKTISRCAGAGHYRRFKGYDYSRGAAIFITFAVARRAKVFGSVDDNGRLLYSPAGMAALSTLSIEERRRDDIIVEKSVIMPDHVHLRLYLKPGMDRPLAKLAQFINNFKRWTKFGSAKICAIRLSRRIPVKDYSTVLERLMAAVDKGFVLAGTFISPCEREVARALIARGAPMIRAVPDPLALVYRPKGDEPRQFADGRLLLLSRVAAPGLSRYDAWHGINDALTDFATSTTGGLSLYATSATDFRFSHCVSD